MSEQDKSHQRYKAQQFLSLAEQAISKHFCRWAHVSLLPAALLSERPLAKIVAAIMLNRAMTFPVQTFQSDVHGRTFDLAAFYHFLLTSTAVQPPTAPDDYDPMSHVCARLLLDNPDFEIRDKATYDIVGSYMLSTYLPLASHTQFVKAGVKEAKIVSQSDRSEQLRSAYAIIRSAEVHSIGTIRDISATDRIHRLIKTATQHVDKSEQLQATQADYSDAVGAIVASMRKEHFKQERVNMLVTAAINKGNVNKKDNAIQKKTGVDTTLVMLGLIPYGKLSKRHGHHES